MKLVDMQDLKSCGQRCPYGFDSRSRYKDLLAGGDGGVFNVKLIAPLF